MALLVAGADAPIVACASYGLKRKRVQRAWNPSSCVMFEGPASPATQSFRTKKVPEEKSIDLLSKLLSCKQRKPGLQTQVQSACCVSVKSPRNRIYRMPV